MCSLGLQHGYHFNPDKPFFGEALCSSEPVDQSDHDAIKECLQKVPKEKREEASRWEQTRHDTEWFFPWTSVRINTCDALLVSIREAELLGVGEVVAFTRFVLAGLKTLHVWQTVARSGGRFGQCYCNLARRCSITLPLPADVCKGE
eukprot:86792-Rhodomonas_salina.1